MSTFNSPQTVENSAIRDVDTLIIGAGQAGLATARELTRRGAQCLVLDAAQEVGDHWRHQYDSLRLFTSNSVNALPGMKFPGPGHAFATKDELADYLQEYAGKFSLQIQLGTSVTDVSRRGEAFVVRSTAGSFRAQNVVIATGPFGSVPSIPEFSTELDPAILQIHSSEYRRPGQLAPGPVLVVGGGHSGCDIAREVASGHPTILSGRDTGEVPVPFDSNLIHLVMPLVMFSHSHLHTRRTAYGRRDREFVLQHGAPRLRVKRRHLMAADVQLRQERVTGALQGKPQLADGTVLDVANVIWATGMHHDYSWLNLPVLDSAGWPREYRGVAQDMVGLYFCGLAYQYSLASLNLHGVGRDAEFIAKRITANASNRAAVRARARAVV